MLWYVDFRYPPDSGGCLCRKRLHFQLLSVLESLKIMITEILKNE